MVLNITNLFAKQQTIGNNQCITVTNLKDVLIKEKEIKTNLKLYDIVKKYKLEFIITSKTGIIINNVTLDDYAKHHRKYKLYILIDSIEKCEAIMKIFSNINIVEDSETEDNTDNSTIIDDDDTEEKAEIPANIVDNEIEEKANNDYNKLYLNDEEQHIINIDDHEIFTDGNGNLIKFEFRGEKTPDKLLINAIDVAKALDLGLYYIRDMFKRDLFLENSHYVILSKTNENNDFSTLGKLPKVLKQDEINNYGKNRLTYFTWFGFMKVLFAGRNTNDFKHKMSTWVTNTMFTHQFGSVDDRQNLAKTLTHYYKKCLNNLSGVYLIKIGNVKDLRVSMDISYDTYSKEFDDACIYKYGRSKNIIERYKQHVKTFQEYSSEIDLQWFAILPEKQEVEAETVLKDYFTDRNLKFEFESNAELVIIRKKELSDVNLQYMQLINRFPSAENEIAMILDKIRTDNEYQIEKLLFQLELEKANRANDNVKYELEIANLTNNHKLQLKDHQIEIITIQFTSFKKQTELEEIIRNLQNKSNNINNITS